MKRFVHHSFMLLSALLLSGASILAQTSAGQWSEKKAKKWFKKNEWKHGLKLDAHASTNKAEFARQYHANQAAWDQAFAFLRDHNLDTLKPGRYPIVGEDVYATVTQAPSKEFDKSAWESHRKYIDLQYVINGQEKIGVAPVASATVSKAYDEARDLQNYTTDGKFYVAQPGTFFLFFPQDAHRPNIKVEGYDVVKKIVIKIRTAS